ncbi:hypothetical protein BU25DRAFT_412668 [Macroventuria anomochaeta]|uniref:Uncharacterized protein n=1 Tax=Macroventuria anomochaeta TaxID=301207 RepID=A0ACB6RWW4_9PLEO|nr:uncharacterized protein BU25DRAFT_412668 [Macroventuria anomochaeta]KAF2625634.1 hypothetical protein BU25DRAFT_412668 [Macroventuria anomochaeta]
MAPSAIRLQWPALLHVPLLLSVSVAQMPYNPTRLLHNGDHLYVFQPSTRSSTQFQLGFIDVSTKIDAASLPYTTLYPTLPFLDDKILRAFTPVLDDGGNLTVYTGNCSQGAIGGEVWSFTSASGDKQSSWLQQDVSVASDKHIATIGANYLSNGISFSSIVGGSAANKGAYFFGGMCPIIGDSSNNWQSAANYSNLMVTLEPSSEEDSAVTYQMDVSSSRGPPIPEAGFTMTGLSPTYSNRSDGSQTKQQNFVLIGGHTSAAFINMSQVALFSLPEQGWTFIGVQQPDASHTDLATRDVTTVDPRSGHTAVLSSDGQQIIVYGGWVGDISSPAEPQLAILNIADGYGGNGKWQWLIPDSNSGNGPSSSSSLYGHGAVMLPGGVMMVTGGYSITTSGSRRRRATPTANTKAYFLNVTSNSWIADYSPPSGPSSSEPAPTGPLSSPGQKAGLGVGIGIGLAAVCGLFAFYMWYTRRLQKQRGLREKQLQDLSFAAHRYNIDGYSPAFDGRGGHVDAMEYLASQNGSYYFPPGSQGGQGWKSAHGQDAERTGLLLEIPSPTRGLRRSLSGKPAYAMGAVRGPGQIHPIDELEEEEEEAEKTTDKTSLTERHEMSERRADPTSSVFDNAPHLDPFFHAQRQSGAKKTVFRSASSSPVLEDVKDHDELMAEWPGPSATVNRRSNTVSTGNIAPDKSLSDERTNSNLSERSTRSNLSWTSSHGSLARSASVRAANITATAQSNPFRSPDASPTHDRPRGYSESSRKTPADPRTQSFSSVRSNGYADIESFRTAQSSFAHLQAEGEVLLGENLENIRPGTSSTSNGSNSHTFGDTEASNSRAATATPATSYALNMSRPESRDVRKSWLGSVRRVLRRSASGADRTRSLTNTISYHEPYTDNPVSPVEASTIDNRKSFPSNLPPRRAASDASFWKSRRGKHDWEEELEIKWTRNSGDDWGAPEDIARAEEDRMRQEWRDRGNLLVNLTSDDELPTPRTPIAPSELGIPSVDHRPCTPADEGDWDVEAAVERRVVQVMFTVPKSKLRVVNADPDGSSILSLPRENSKEGDNLLKGDTNGSPSRVKDLAGKFEQMSGSKISSPRMTPRASPVPSPSPSVRSMKVRAKRSSTSLNRQGLGQGNPTRPLADLKAKDNIVEK